MSRPKAQMRPIEIVAWWEIRRIPYNLIVGAVGVISLVLFFLFVTWSGALKPGEDAVEPMALMATPFVINVCYTAGWILELLLMAIRRHHVRVGPLLLAIGTVFSLIVVATPTVSWGAVCLLELIGVMR